VGDAGFLGILYYATFYGKAELQRLREECRADYLTDVITRLARGWPASRLDELLPWNWQDSTAIHGPPAPQRRAAVHTAAEIIELSHVRARVKSARATAASN
jgi:hypothetical protein